MAKEKSPGKIGAENELKFVELRKSQGYISFKRNRSSRFGKYDLWGRFDVFSMKKDGCEFAQVKTANRPDTRGELKRIAEWIQENRDKIPIGTSFVVAVWVTPEERFYVKEIEW